MPNFHIVADGNCDRPKRGSVDGGHSVVIFANTRMPFFLYRDGDDVKMAEGDDQVGSHLHDQGYELFSRPLFTTEEAATEERAWQERVDKMRAQGLL